MDSRFRRSQSKKGYGQQSEEITEWKKGYGQQGDEMTESGKKAMDSWFRR